MLPGAPICPLNDILTEWLQYAPQLFSYIKIEIDNGAEPGSFWLTGSQAFRMMELAQESLAGRAALLHMPSLSQHEIYGGGVTSPFVIDLNALKERVKTHTPRSVGFRFWKNHSPIGEIHGEGIEGADYQRLQFLNNPTMQSLNFLKIKHGHLLTKC